MAASPKQPSTTTKVKAPQTPITKLQQDSINKFLIIAISLTALTVLVGGYFIYQLANKNIQVANQIKAQEIYIKLADKKLDTLKEAEAKLVDLKKADSSQVSDFARITERVMPPNEDLGVVFTIFQKISEDTIVKIDNITKNKGVTSTASASTPVSSIPGTVKPFSLTFKATGKYDLIQQFLKELEGSQKVFDFSTLKITGTNEVLTLEMTYKVYFMDKPDIKDTSMPLSEYQAKGGVK